MSNARHVRELVLNQEFLKNCRECGGTGQIRKISRSAFGQMVNITTCRTCGGSGKIIERPCQECRGRGSVEKVQKIEISIPKGVNDGQYLRIAGGGEPGIRGGPPGDLYVVVHLKPHPSSNGTTRISSARQQLISLQLFSVARLKFPLFREK
jgi:DnaJ-class molecular chaperone